MLRNRIKRDFMGYEPEMSREPGLQPLPPVSQLDSKDERLLELSQYLGQLEGQNDLLNEDNRRLEEDNEQLRDRNKELQTRNTNLEQQAAKDHAVDEFVDNVERELNNRKVTKEK